MMQTYVTLIISLLIATNAFSNCEEDFISGKYIDGSIITLDYNGAWEVDAIDRIKSRYWQPTHNVAICDDDTITNENLNHKVSAIRTYN